MSDDRPYERDRERDSDASSWLESRRLILSQLRAMDGSIRDLSQKIDKQADLARERVVLIASQTQETISDLRERIAMLEVSAKIWGGVIGLVAGAVSAGLVDALMSHAIH